LWGGLSGSEAHAVFIERRVGTALVRLSPPYDFSVMRAP
jgi:hypothetical protein